MAVSGLVEFTREEKAEQYWRAAFRIELREPIFNPSMLVRWQNFLYYHVTLREASSVFRAGAIKCHQVADPTGYETDAKGNKWFCSKMGARWLSLRWHRAPWILWCFLTGRSAPSRIPRWAR